MADATDTDTDTDPETDYETDIEIDTEAEVEAEVEENAAVIHSPDAEFSFENFYTDGANRFPASVARAVAKTPGDAYNPLLFYGSRGVGKTHLLHAIGNAIAVLHERAQVAYIHASAFAAAAVHAAEEDENEAFRAPLRDVDVLLVDDLETLGDDRLVHSEFATLALGCYSNRKQLVITANRPHDRLALLDDDLSRLLKKGLEAKLERPDFEAKLAMIKREKLMQRLSSRFKADA